MTIGPLAIPGDAGSPVVSGSPRRSPATARRGGSASSAATRSDGLPRVSGKPASSAMSTAIRSAACGLRLPTRVWSIHSRPCSMVNSMSHRSA